MLRRSLTWEETNCAHRGFSVLRKNAFLNLFDLDLRDVYRNCLLIFLLAFCGPLTLGFVSAQDSLYTRYGDLLIGNVEKITAEKIFFKTAYRSSAVDIKLKEIADMKSSASYLLNDINNKNWRGQLELDSASSGLVGIRTADSVYYFPQKRIFEVSKDRRKRFKDRFKLGIDLGYTRAKTDNTLSLSVGLNARYKTRRWDTGLNYKDYAASVGSNIVARSNLDYDLAYIIPKEWFFNGKFSLFASTEQSLDLRRNFSLGLGKNLVHREERLLAISGGVVSNKEKYTDNPAYFKSVEAMMNARFNGKFTDRLQLVADWGFFPSLTERSRVRNNINLDIKYIFLHHFNFGISYVLNTDNKPPLETGTSDYVFAVKFGWTFQRQ